MRGRDEESGLVWISRSGLQGPGRERRLGDLFLVLREGLVFTFHQLPEVA